MGVGWTEAVQTSSLGLRTWNDRERNATFNGASFKELGLGYFISFQICAIFVGSILKLIPRLLEKF